MAGQYVMACYAAGDQPASDVPVLSAGRGLTCGSMVDASGVALMAYMEPSSGASDGSDSAIPGGETVGLEIGGAMLLVMASAWGIRAVRRFIDSESGE